MQQTAALVPWSGFRVTTIALSLGFCWATNAAAAEPDPSSLAMPSRLVLWKTGEPSPTLDYAARQTAFELRELYGLTSRETAGSLPPEFNEKTEGLVVICDANRTASLIDWAHSNGFGELSAVPGPEGYRLAVRDKPLRVLVRGSDEIGTWYGLCGWLDSIRSEPDGSPRAGLGDQQGKPGLKIRFTRPIQANPRFKSVEEMRSSLDWWAQWRMNVALGNGYPEPLWSAFIQESHQRGIRVLCVLGVRNLRRRARRGRQGRRVRTFSQLGGDGAFALWDDLPRERCKGHCDACRKRFGENSLPREIVHVLESLAAVAARQTAPPLIIWCPPHYSARRYRDMPDEVFFQEGRQLGGRSTMDAHVVLRSVAGGRRLADRNGLTQRVWWYNGVRSVYHCKLWARTRDIKRDLAFSQNGFPASSRVGKWASTSTPTAASSRLPRPTARRCRHCRNVMTDSTPGRGPSLSCRRGGGLCLVAAVVFATGGGSACVPGHVWTAERHDGPRVERSVRRVADGSGDMPARAVRQRA